MKAIALLALLLAPGCGSKWEKLIPGEEGVLTQPLDSRLGTVLSSGRIAATPRLEVRDEPGYDAPTTPKILELSPGQAVRVVAENEYAAEDDRGRPIGVTILDGPHSGLKATIRRDQFTRRPGR